VKDEDIHSLFADAFLPVREVELLESRSGGHYLVATFDRFEHAEGAVAALAGKRTPFTRGPLGVHPYEEDGAKGGAGAAPAGRGPAPAAGGGSGTITVVKKTSAEHPSNAGARVSVFNLPWDLTEPELQQIFAGAGRINSVHLERRADGKSAGRGTIVFARADGAARAVSEFHDALVNDRAIRVELA
jgi:hypothetical protein